MSEQVGTGTNTKALSLVAIVGLCALLSIPVQAQNSAVPLDFDAESFMRDLSGAESGLNTEFTWVRGRYTNYGGGRSRRGGGGGFGGRGAGGIPITLTPNRISCVGCSVIPISMQIVRVMIF